MSRAPSPGIETSHPEKPAVVVFNTDKEIIASPVAPITTGMDPLRTIIDSAIATLNSVITMIDRSTVASASDIATKSISVEDKSQESVIPDSVITSSIEPITSSIEPITTSIEPITTSIATKSVSVEDKRQESLMSDSVITTSIESTEKSPAKKRVRE